MTTSVRDRLYQLARDRGLKVRDAGEEKVHQTMSEFKRGELRSGSERGPKVKSRKQAIAIALSQAGKSNRDTRDSIAALARDRGLTYDAGTSEGARKAAATKKARGGSAGSTGRGSGKFTSPQHWFHTQLTASGHVHTGHSRIPGHPAGLSVHHYEHPKSGERTSVDPTGTTTVGHRRS